MSECFCCAEEYNITSRKKITCNYFNKETKKICGFHSCQKCYRRYILDSGIAAQCMKCNHTFSREFMIYNFARNWIDTTYSQHMRELLFQTEQAKCKDLLDDVVKYKSIDRMQSTRLNYPTQFVTSETKGQNYEESSMNIHPLILTLILQYSINQSNLKNL